MKGETIPFDHTSSINWSQCNDRYYKIKIVNILSFLKSCHRNTLNILKKFKRFASDDFFVIFESREEKGGRWDQTRGAIEDIKAYFFVRPP